MLDSFIQEQVFQPLGIWRPDHMKSFQTETPPINGVKWKLACHQLENGNMPRLEVLSPAVQPSYPDGNQATGDSESLPKEEGTGLEAGGEHATVAGDALTLNSDPAIPEMGVAAGKIKIAETDNKASP